MKYEKSNKKNLKFIYDTCIESMNIDLRKRTRVSKYVRARLIYYKIARENTFCSLAEIGSLVHTDHATVRFNLEKFDADIMGNDFLFKRYKDINEVCSTQANSKSPSIIHGQRKKINILIDENTRLTSKIRSLKIELDKSTEGGLEEKLIHEFRLLPFSKKMDVISKIQTTRKVYEKFRDSQKDVRHRDSGVQREARQ